MNIIENRAQWLTQYQNGFLTDYPTTGNLNWMSYPRVRNKNTPAGPAIDLSQSRLMFISTAGGYLRDSQEPFDAEGKLGDYSIRVFPVDTPFEAIAYAHTHYNHAAVNADPQVLLPLRHLADLVDEGVIGELAPSMVSFMGYQPDVTRVADEMIPAILEAAQKEEVQAALLVPA